MRYKKSKRPERLTYGGLSGLGFSRISEFILLISQTQMREKNQS
jgi:hypothetical protein